MGSDARRQPWARIAGLDRRGRGLSTIELLVTVAIAVMLMGIGAPSMMAGIRSHQLRAVRDELTGALQLAEVEALRRATPIVLARRTSCGLTLGGPGDWRCGYTIFADTNGNGSQDATEPSLKVIDVPANVELNHMAGGTDTVLMNQWGKASGGGQRFVLTSGSGTTAVSTTVCVNAAGRQLLLNGNSACP